MTDAQGALRLRVPEGKEYALRVSLPGYQPFEQEKIVVLPRGSTPLRVTLVEDLRGTATLRLRLVFPTSSADDSSEPMTVIRVQTSDGSLAWVTWVTDRESVDFHLPRNRSYSVLVERSGFEPARASGVYVRPQEPTVIELSLQPRDVADTSR